MIISSKKEKDEVLSSLKNYKKVLLLGCSECATVCHTGGEPELEEMKQFLEENNKKVVDSIVLTTSCNDLTTKKELRKYIKEKDFDVILSLACGNGVQTVANFFDIPVVPGNNTNFVGERIRNGIFEENCRTCGDCLLGRTAAICPVTRCAKGLLNGGCGGSSDGKCEVDPDQDCAWVLIYDRLEKNGQLDLLEELHPIRNYESSSHRRNLNLREKH